MEFKNYDIKISIDDVNRKFTGRETVRLSASNEEILLNAVDLDIYFIRINGKDVEFKVLKDEEEIRISGKFDGDLTLETEFSGSIQDILMGLYFSQTSSGDFYTTQFESTGARRVFPCMDNPGYKAEFSLTLAISKDLNAISNMPVESEKAEGESKIVAFQKTPRMSTYLLYIGVGKLDERSEKFNDVDLIIAAPKGHLGEVELPFQFAKDSIRHFEEYFGIKYVLPKMHLISVPDFGAGAMENWGAITFREVLLNVSPSTSALIKRTIAEVISHEIAHQWFGNLVTMKWWNDLWLNESFATFMAYKTVDRFHKDWDMWGLFLLSETSGALSGDALKGSHPIDVEVRDPNSVAQIFDEISYGKGGSILRMIESFVGEDNFRDGIRKYLKEHQFGNAVGKDLWSSIASVSDQPVEEIMGAWVKKQGYPVITATRNGDKIHLEQRRFLISGEQTEDLWPIPLTVKNESGVKSVLFKDRSMDIDAEGFMKLNADQTGFYRVNYGDDLFSAVMGKGDNLTGLDKWGLANDLYSFLSAGRISVDDYFDRIAAFLEDVDPIVAESVAGQLLSLHLIIPENRRLKDIADMFFRKQLERIGEKKDGEKDRISILRGTLSNAYAVINEDYAKQLAPLFKKFEETDPDLRSAISASFAISSNELGTLAEKLKAMKSDEDRIKIIGAMGWLSGKNRYDGVMELIENNTIKKQDMIRFFMSAAMNPAGRDFMLENYEKMADEMNRYFVGTGYTGMIIEATLPYLGLRNYSLTREIAEKVRQPETEKGVQKGLELLEVYARIRKGSGQ
ncbi:hypothetical protein IX51_02885 [uncultured archaeon]|nr:hypothetical protein IX51_02885 [uncultured archaeon]